MVKRRDFQKVASVVKDFLLKLGHSIECAELRDALSLALFQLQRYYRKLQRRMDKAGSTRNSFAAESFRGHRPMTGQNLEDKFVWKWFDLQKNRTPEMSDQDSDKVPEILVAAQHGNNTLIVEIIDTENGAALLQQHDLLGRNALMYAVSFSQLDTIELLLNQGIDINSSSNDGTTALHWACCYANDEALEILLQYGANVAVADTLGRTPLHWAAICPDSKCLELLFDYSVDVSASDANGLTPAMWASYQDRLENLRLLQNHIEAKQLQRDNCGRTWVHWCVRPTEPMTCLAVSLDF